MKKISELTEEQILTLTEADLDKMVRLVMAEKGIKILKMPIESGYEQLPPKTEVAFKVTGFEYKFTNKAIADAFADQVNIIKTQVSTSSYNYSDYSTPYLKAVEEYQIDNIGQVAKEEFYTKEDALKVVDIKKQNEALKSEYNALLDDYNKSKDESSEIRSEIFDRYAEVNQKYYEMNSMVERYKEYLDIANGDDKIAMAFLKRAYSVNLETEEYINSKNQKKATKQKPKVTEEKAIDDDLIF